MLPLVSWVEHRRALPRPKAKSSVAPPLRANARASHRPADYWCYSKFSCEVATDQAVIADALDRRQLGGKTPGAWHAQTGFFKAMPSRFSATAAAVLVY